MKRNLNNSQIFIEPRTSKWILLRFNANLRNIYVHDGFRKTSLENRPPFTSQQHWRGLRNYHIIEKQAM